MKRVAKRFFSQCAGEALAISGCCSSRTSLRQVERVTMLARSWLSFPSFSRGKRGRNFRRYSLWPLTGLFWKGRLQAQTSCC